jgi:hypothetical protein
MVGGVETLVVGGAGRLLWPGVGALNVKRQRRRRRRGRTSRVKLGDAADQGWDVEVAGAVIARVVIAVVGVRRRRQRLSGQRLEERALLGDRRCHGRWVVGVALGVGGNRLGLARRGDLQRLDVLVISLARWGRRQTWGRHSDRRCVVAFGRDGPKRLDEGRRIIVARRTSIHTATLAGCVADWCPVRRTRAKCRPNAHTQTQALWTEPNEQTLDDVSDPCGEHRGA